MPVYKDPLPNPEVNTLPAVMPGRLTPHSFPIKVRKAIRNGPVGTVLRTMRWMRARVITRSLSSDEHAYEQSPSDRLAAATMSVVVPIHDAPSIVKRCLESLERYAIDAEIILVDDSSKLPETLDIIRQFSDRKRWKLVSKVKAGGHSLACAAGAHHATRPYLCLLNSDTVVTPWCWRAIREAFESDPRIGLAGPSTSRSGNKQTLSVAADCRFEWSDNQICAFARRLQRVSIEPSIVDLPWIAGFAFFIRRTLWRELGGFDQNLTDYGNEFEFCRRAVITGHRIVWVRHGYIHHFGQQSYAQVMSMNEIQQRKLEGARYAYRKHS
jgi:GT2 family glycosyltransferase